MSREERANSKATLSASLAATGAAIGSVYGPVGTVAGGTLGALTGLVVGDQEIVFPMDYVAIPSFEYALVRQGMAPSQIIYIKEGEVLTQVQTTEAQETQEILTGATPTAPAPKRRKASAYNRRYAKAFKQVAPKYKKKGGGWRKGGFKAAQREAHRMAKK